MNTKLGLAVAGAVLAFGASSAANAGITIPAGDWTIDIGGNVNAYYTNTRFSSDFEKNLPKGAPREETGNTISTGLLPSALGVGGKTRQNDLDIAFQFTFFTGVDSTNGFGTANVYGANGGGGNSINIRQAYLTFGDASWGTIKMGRDLGVFGSDAILSDMTLLGVGTGAGGNGSSTLGRIGSGYIYADWVGQIQYASPNWNGFSFAVAARQPWGNSSNHDLGFDGKVSYEWAGDIAGKVWAGFLTQKTRDSNYTTASGVILTGTGASNSERANLWEIGGKVNVSDFGLVGYYYDGKGAGRSAVVSGNLPLSGIGLNANDQDVKGGYVQGTYTIPGVGTKLGLSWGKSEVEGNAGNPDFENKSWIIGAYHPLTKSLNLVAEYTDTKYEDIGNVRGFDGKARTVALGAILFF